MKDFPKNLHLAITIPAYNERKSIKAVIVDILRKIKQMDKKSIVVIDDGSTDNTAREIPDKKDIYLVRHLRNKGLGRSFDEGIRKSLELGADIIVNIDGDGQFDPEQINKLVHPIIKGKAELVLGSRFIKKNSYRTSFSKRVGNKFLATLVSAVIGQRIFDVTCGFRAYSREAALNLNIYDRFSYTLESLIELSHKGFKIAEIPVDVKTRQFGKSKIASNLFYYGTKSTAILTRSLRDNKPFHFFVAPALLALALSLSGFIFLLIRFVKYQALSPYRSVLSLSIVFFVVSIFIFGLGMLFDQLNKIKKNQEDILYYLKNSGQKRK
jgi:glycosyltransferase involved in cell wall biosynthesis